MNHFSSKFDVSASGGLAEASGFPVPVSMFFDGGLPTSSAMAMSVQAGDLPPVIAIDDKQLQGYLLDTLPSLPSLPSLPDDIDNNQQGAAALPVHNFPELGSTVEIVNSDEKSNR